MATLKLLKSYDEVGNIRTFVFDTAGQAWIAGQYQTYVLAAAGDTKDDNQRFFTIAAAPSEGEIHISTRVSESKFKQALNAMQPGDTIETKGIEGDFTWEETGDPVVLVAAGIGCTPYRSILLERHAAGKPLNCVLVQFSRDEDIPFKEEFAKLAAEHPEFTIKNLVGNPVTADAILEAAPQAAEQVTYLSGPEPMVDAVGDELKTRGVTLKQDWFPGYTEQTF